MGRDSQYDAFKKEKSSELKEFRRFSEFLAISSLKKFSTLGSVKHSQRYGALLGKLAYQFAKKDRSIAEYQIDFCFPELSSFKKQQIVRESFENLGKTLMEALNIQKIRKNRDFWIRLHNEDVVNQVIEKGKGVIFIFGHFGNWELLGLVYEMLGIKGIGIESPIGDVKLDGILSASRKSENIQLIPRGNTSSAKNILKCFRNNQAFLFAFDQDIKVQSVFVDFFGKKASTAKGAAFFAQKFNVPVVSVFGARNKEGVHDYYFELLSESPYQNSKFEINKLTQIYTLAVEKHIRRFPNQWVWFHRRWKTQPDQ